MSRPRLSWNASTLGILLGGSAALTVLAGYALDVERLWRPVGMLPATHSYTALCLLMLAIASMPGRSPGVQRSLARLAIATLLVLLFVRLLEPVVGAGAFEALTPFRTTLGAYQVPDRPIRMPYNTAFALTLLCLSELFRRMRHPLPSQLMAACALALLFVALAGQLGGLSGFSGAMAPLSLVGCGALAVALLFSTSRRSFMRALTTPSAPGRVGRWLLGGSTLLLLLSGCLVSRSIDHLGVTLPAHGALLVYQSAAIIVLTWSIVTVVTVRANKLERERSIARRLLERKATRDALTGLFTRNKMMRLLDAQDRTGRTPAALLFIDLDGFRNANDAFGADQGDSVLVEVATRLRTASRVSPVGRIGGDEFAIYCADMSLEDAVQLGAAVTASLAQPFDVHGRSFRLSASIGIAHTDNAKGIELRQAADDALYGAKRGGGHQAVVFVRSMRDERKGEVELEQDLHEALKNDDELWLAYQPVMHIADGGMVALEGLARWNHPRLGPIPPDRFIRLAEQKGLIVALGLKLLGTAVRQAAAWEREHPGRWPTINLNVSPLQFVTGDVVADLMDMLTQHGLPASRFCIEVTEGVFANERAIRALRRARSHGFSVAMDDFGVGYSNLSQLPRLPLTSVKLDRSFIVHATESAGDAAVLAAIVELAHALSLQVVAEGVETEAQLNLVSDSGCDAAQGYLFARPMPPSELLHWHPRLVAPSPDVRSDAR